MKSSFLKQFKTVTYGAFIVLSVSALVSCKQKVSYGYTFEHALSVTPVQNSYNVGDTIYFEIDMPSDMEVLVHNETKNTNFYKTFQLSDFDFYDGVIDCYEINQIGTEYTKLPALNSFNRVPYSGTLLSNDNTSLVYRLHKGNGEYHFKVGFVCLESGMFYFNPKTSYAGFSRVNPPADLNLSPEADYDYVASIMYPVNRDVNGSYNNNASLFPAGITPNVVPIAYQTQSFLVIVN